VVISVLRIHGVYRASKRGSCDVIGNLSACVSIAVLRIVNKRLHTRDLGRQRRRVQIILDG
jgi:hypothetical protein